jgi:signal transduction histidine kinase
VLRSLIDWWRATDVTVRDSGLVVALAILAFVPGASGVGVGLADLPPHRQDILAVVLVLAQSLPLVLRTRWPALCLTVVAAAFGAYEVLAYPPTFASFGLCLALYAAGAHQDRRRGPLVVVATLAYVGLAVAVHQLGSPRPAADLVVFYLALVACFTIGGRIRGRRREEVKRRQVSVETARAAERSTTARELHDVVTQHVSHMVERADTAQFLFPQSDGIAAGLTSISGTGRRALAELRYLLGVLDATGDSPRLERRAGLNPLRELVEQTKLSGQPVELIELGDQLPMTVVVELAVFRVVQESLANAVRYAPGRQTEVRIGSARDMIDVQVTTAGPAVSIPAQSRGHGLDSLRVRVGMLGGDLVAESLLDGGFTVRATIPTS